MTNTAPALVDLDHPAGPGKVALIGMMGAGKSVTGQLVAARLGWPWIDTDEHVQRRAGRTVAEIFAERGEAAFRAEEAGALAEIMARDGPLIVSVAGGAVLRADNRRLLRRGGLIVWLRADVATLAGRVGAGDHRPLLAGDHIDRLAVLYRERRPHYQVLAEVVIDVDALTPAQVADQVAAAITTRRVPTAAVSAPGGGEPGA